MVEIRAVHAVHAVAFAGLLALGLHHDGHNLLRVSWGSQKSLSHEALIEDNIEDNPAPSSRMALIEAVRIYHTYFDFLPETYRRCLEHIQKGLVDRSNDCRSNAWHLLGISHGRNA